MRYGRYETLRELGRGSMGIVYEAHDPQIDRTVALKVLRPEACVNELSVQRFLREAQTIGRLSHPRIVTVYDIGGDHGTLFIAMEHLEGEPLNTRMKAKRFTTGETLDLGIQMAETLDHAHGKGVVHRDIKPSNIVVRSDGTIKITDFGIAHMEDSACTLRTHQGEILGTPAFMSPEQVLGRPVDGRSDLFSVGVILYQLSTGQRPFGHQGSTLASMLHAIVHASPPEPSELDADVDPELSRVIMRCLGKEPEDRYPTGAALADALRECRRGGQAGFASRLRSAFQRQASAVGFVHVFLAVALSLAATLFYTFTPPPMADVAKWPEKTAAGNAMVSGPTAPSLADALVPDVTQEPSGAVFTQAQVATRQSGERDGTHIPGGERIALARSSTGREPHDPDVEGAADVKRPLPPVQVKGILEIVSDPPGAEVLVDGEPAGVTPFVSRVPPGERRVTVRSTDHAPWERTLQVEAGKEYPFEVALTPAKKEAVLAVASEPPGARILVNGAPRGETPSTLKLPPGKHKVKLQHKRFKTYQTEVVLARADERSIEARLTPVQPRATRVAQAQPPPPHPISTVASQVRYQLSPHTLWRRVRSLF
ncbi:MAG: protein kinase [Syntrophobacteraceae bacterium]|nr:protein kinase [Syntrophobacteraceae bacterium]